MTLPLAVLDGPVLWLILALAILLFGGSKLPELARGLGKAKREFKKASDEVEDEVRNAVEEDERKKIMLRIIDQYDKIGQVYSQIGILSDDDDERSS